MLEFLNKDDISETVAFIITRILGKLRLEVDSKGKLYPATSSAYKILERMCEGVSNVAIPGHFHTDIIHEIEVNQFDKTVKIYFRRQGIQGKQLLFYGYSTFDMLDEMIRLHDQLDAVAVRLDQISPNLHF